MHENKTSESTDLSFNGSMNQPQSQIPTHCALTYKHLNYLKKRQMVGILFVLPTVVFTAIFILYPLLYNILLSLTNANLLKNSFSFVGINNYVKLFTNSDFPKYLWNTLIWTVFSVAGEMIIGFLLAELINRKSMHCGPAIRTFLLIPYVVPAVALALVTRWVMNGDYGIISTWMQSIGLIAHRQSLLSMPGSAMAVLIIINIWRSYPFSMLIYWAALKGIDKSLYEAASIDGAGRIQLCLNITLPQLKDTTIVLAVVRIVWTATYFDLIWMVTGGGPAGSTTHLPIMIYQASFGTFQVGYASAISVVLGILLFFCVIFYVKNSTALED